MFSYVPSPFELKQPIDSLKFLSGFVLFDGLFEEISKNFSDQPDPRIRLIILHAVGPYEASFSTEIAPNYPLTVIAVDEMFLDLAETHGLLDKIGISVAVNGVLEDPRVIVSAYDGKDGVAKISSAFVIRR